MKENKKKSYKPRSVRFYDEQEEIFSKLEDKGFNISFLLRKVADKMIKENNFLINDSQAN